MDVLKEGIRRNLEELEQVSATIQKMKAEQKSKKEAIDNALAVFGLTYQRCSTCKGVGSSEDGTPCPACDGLKVILIPIEDKEAKEG